MLGFVARHPQTICRWQSLLGQTFSRTRLAEGRIADRCQPTAAPWNPFGLPPTEPLPRRAGVYFTRSRPGNGLVNFARRVSPVAYRAVQHDAFAGVWYTALSDRTPTWYTLEGELTNGGGELAVRQFINAAAPDGFEASSEIVG